MTKKIKTIKTLVEIPAEYKWRAQDEGGIYWAFINKPKPDNECGVWFNDSSKGNPCVIIGRGNPNPRWRDTLERIEEYEDVTDEN